MATRMLRRGLPRVPGGEPWPPADAVVDGVAEVDASPVEAGVSAVPGAHEGRSDVEAPPAPTGIPDPGSPASAESAAAVTPVTAGRAPQFRRGLPRVPGGDPWPPSSTAPASRGQVPEPAVVAATPAPTLSAPAAAGSVTAAAVLAPSVEATSAHVSAPCASGTTEGSAEPAVGVRRGLPRVVGGEPWPPAETVPHALAQSPASETGASEPMASDAVTPVPAAAAAAVVAAPSSELADVSTPLPWTRTVWNGRAPRHVTAPAPATGRPRPTWTQAIGVLFGAAALGVLAGAAIAFVRTLLSFPFMQDFLMAFPGEYEPAVAVEPGFAPWIGWQHFFNMFLMVLIIRSGLQVRTEKRPTVFWTPRNNAKGKISLNLWFHQSLDILWLVNGVIFVVLLFATGHWARIVPTSWEVFPNALSAALQYVSFDWPHENGWNNYNSLQQLAYFVTVFIAAPLAAITGFRMSGLWPKKAERLSKAYPVEWARALHFPIMLYFVAFIIAHVALVMLTGFLRNLNHMFASQDAVTWTGFWVFVLSLVVIAIAWVAARPLVLAPIAKAFGKVSGR